MKKSKPNPKSNTTSKKKRLVVLKGNILLYFKTKEDKAPAGVIPCEYFTARLEMSQEPGMKQTAQTIVLEKSYQGFSFRNDEYMLQAPEEAINLMDWFQTIQEKCAPGGDHIILTTVEKSVEFDVFVDVEMMQETHESLE